MGLPDPVRVHGFRMAESPSLKAWKQPRVPMFIRARVQGSGFIGHIIGFMVYTAYRV